MIDDSLSGYQNFGPDSRSLAVLFSLEDEVIVKKHRSEETLGATPNFRIYTSKGSRAREPVLLRERSGMFRGTLR